MATVHQQLTPAGEVDAGRLGLSTSEALGRLHDDITAELERARLLRGGWLQAAGRRWRAVSARDWCCWQQVTLSLAAAAALLATAALSGAPADAVAAVLVLVLAAASVALAVYQQHIADGEVLAKAFRLTTRLRLLREKCEEFTQSSPAAGGVGNYWADHEYPHHHAPPSPCISLQWTYRDGRLVNLPASLLARGDVVLIRPGETVLADVEAVDAELGQKLSRLEQYVPTAAARPSDEKLSQPRLVLTLPNRRFRVLSTPYLESLRLALRTGCSRPTPALRLLLQRLLIHLLLAAAAASVLAAAAAALLQHHLLPTAPHGAVVLLARLCGGLVPALPLACSLLLVPAIWLAQSRLVALAAEMRKPAARAKHTHHLDVLDETSVAEHVAAGWREVWPVFLRTARGQCDSLPHTAGLFFTLGALSSLCCVDKKGVLSWPNPTAEKVVTMKLTGPAGGAGDVASDDGSGDSNDPDLDPVTSDAVLEVLDLTRDNPAEPWDVQFDDPHWRESLARLKPIGLSVLVNTCSDSTLEQYWRFCRHLACLAQGDADLVPVPARRCLCQLARHIGFSSRAADAFQLDAQVACYKHLKLDPARRDKLSRTFSFSRIRFPYPHMSSVILRELYTNSLQLVSQGTADLVLDSCSDFWDGTDVVPLADVDRRRVLDFYHRHSLTMYCSAFAYRPLTTKVSLGLSDRYLELPAESGHIYRAVRSPPPLSLAAGSEPRERPVHPQYMSTDSLYGSEVNQVDSTEGLIQVQCNQIFTGMVTMQYQALADMVRLIDQLEKACIRFVHFSKENELRSRVFSEKMGLESGWNCHISLLDEGAGTQRPSVVGVKGVGAAEVDDPAAGRRPLSGEESGPGCGGSQLEKMRPMSVSAPSVINLDVSQVTFGDQISLHDMRTDEAAPRAERLTPASPHGSGMQDHSTASRSPSHVTDSTEQSGPVNFDMSNRAKLPKGIAQIRPHLEHVDNVPLQVSLFTDCTPQTTRSMLEIMQEYGEVVCVLGSSGNAQNAAVFLQADAALAVRPLHPQLCSQRPHTCSDGGWTNSGAAVTNGRLSDSAEGLLDKPLLEAAAEGPLALAERLDSLPCSLLIRRDDSVSLAQLILEARHLVQRLRTAVAFWACQAAALSTLAVLCALLLLPPPLPALHTMWFTWVQVPLLSAALLCAPVEPRLMEEAQDLCQPRLSWQRLLHAAWCYGLRVLPSTLMAASFFGLSLRATCAPQPCEYVYPSPQLRTVQHALLLLLVLYSCVTSASLLHRRAQLWQRWPCLNRCWVVGVAASLLAAVLLVVLDCAVVGEWPRWPARAGPHLALATLAGPPLQLAINELVRRVEIKHNIRHQKRSRLEFDTKLGMNSPF